MLYTDLQGAHIMSLRIILAFLLIHVCFSLEKVQEGPKTTAGEGDSNNKLTARQEDIAGHATGVLGEGWPSQSGMRRIKSKPPSEVCTTESQNGLNYYDRCNWCRCVDVGAAACTRRACPLEPAVMPRIRSIPASVICTSDNAGKSYNDGCNRCFCHQKSVHVAGCTLMMCPELLPFDDIVVSTTEETCKTATNGTAFYETECRLCICTGKNTSWCYDTKRPGCLAPPMTKYLGQSRRRIVSPFIGKARKAENQEPPTALPRLTVETACATSADEGKTYFNGCNWCRCFGVANALCSLRPSC